MVDKEIKEIEVFEDQIEEENVIVASEDDEDNDSICVEESEDSEPEISTWKSAEDFERYIIESSRKLPKFDYNSINSLRRVAQYLDNLIDEIVDGVAKDADYAELDMNQLQTLDAIEEGITETKEIVREAMKGNKPLRKVAFKTTSFDMFVTPFEFGIARLCINAKVSSGKNIEDMFGKLAQKFNLSDREKLSILFVIKDSGYPIRESFIDGIDNIEQFFA